MKIKINHDNDNKFIKDLKKKQIDENGIIIESEEENTVELFEE